MKYNKNQSYFGFKLLDERQLEEIEGVGRHFIHEKSGAQLLHIEADDDNKVFSISFRTPPTDSTGLPHILEHSVLCGSRKFPVKDPFIELAKGSLNTFLNAMTFSDKTMYPIASRNEKDFINLMDVYLDAVFYPNIYDEAKIMKQEGWHYDLENENDDITYKGVVYNEMKGAFSSPEQVLYRKIQQSLFPDTPYSTESGGDPEFIPDLTQEDFIEFHKKYYHPSNSYIYLYGDGNLEEQLKWLDEQYLKDFDKIQVDSTIEKQKPFNKTHKSVEKYSIASNENEKDKTFLSCNFVIGSAEDRELNFALEILEYILLEAPGAPLKQALIDAGVGKDVFGFADTSLLQPTMSIIAKDANKEDEEKFIETIQKTLEKIVADGIDKSKIEAAINIVEFKLREADYGSYPKGLIYGISVMESWLYDFSPMIPLQYNQTIEAVKKSLQTNYFEEMIQKHLLDNQHCSILIVEPEKGLAAKKEQKIKKKLADYKASLSEEEVKALVEDTKSLLEYQIEPSKEEDVKKIPLLKLEDIDKKFEKIDLDEKEVDQVKVLFHPDHTNKIGYVNLYFNLEGLEKEDIPYLGLLSSVLGKMNTENYTYSELSSQINIHTGGIKYTVAAFSKEGDTETFYPKFRVTTKAFTDKTQQQLELVKEILLTTKFSDLKRLKELIAEIKSRLKMSMTGAGHSTAAARAQSYFSPDYAYEELVKGASYYHFIEKCYKDFDEKGEEIAEKLLKVINSIVGKNNLLVGYTNENENYNVFEDELSQFIAQLPEVKTKEEGMSFELPSVTNEGLMTSAEIQYVAKAGNFIKEGFEFSGHMSVLKTILSLDYLWNKVRVTGGAYGCMAGISRTGNIYFTSYRDPNLKKTLDTYDNMHQYISEFDCSDRELVKYIIGTVSRLDTPLTPAMKGVTAIERRQMGLTHEALQKMRDEVLDTNVDHIRQLAPVIEKTLNQNYLCVQGNEDAIKQNRALFNEVIDLFE